MAKHQRGRDPTMIRLFRAVVTALTFGIAIIIFIMAWITVPEEDDGGVM
jgi:phage shock protein PspC (stress-responsive transcriptional regulator)